MRSVRLIALLALVGLLTGCALFTKPADTVSFNRMELAVMRGDVKAAIVALEMRLTQACTTQRLSAETCGEIARLVDRARDLDHQLVAALMNPKTEVDWAEIMKVMQLVVSIAMKMV